MFPEIWETRRIGGRRPVNQKDVKVLNCLQMLSSGNCPNRNDEVAYISVETSLKNLHDFFQHFIEIYGTMYMKRWPTVREIVEIEQQYKSKGLSRICWFYLLLQNILE